MGRDDDFDDVDDVLDDRRAELEARFQELERDAEIERLRQQAGAPPREAQPPPAQPPPADDKPAGGDPLAGMKAVLETEGELERFLLVICPHCDAKNRMSLTRVRTAKPVCGRCKQDLSFVKV